MAKELSTAELERMYDEMAALGLGQAALDCFRRHHGLPMPERRAPALVIRAVPSPTRRPRSHRKTTKLPATKVGSFATPATSNTRVAERFDLDLYGDSNE